MQPRRWWVSVCCLATCASAADWEQRLDHGSLRHFPTLDEAETLLGEWLRQYPSVLRKQKIGASLEGRDIHAYVLGTQQSTFVSRPQVLLTSLMHSREPTGLTVLLYFIGHLLELHQQQDPRAVYTIEMRELWAVPFVNPDGYVANQNLHSQVIRKNRRKTCCTATDSGVDINRNFAFHWRKEFAPCSEEFQGTKPFSEPETQALKKVIDEHSFVTAVNFHSFGSMLTHPYNFGHQALPEDDQRIYDEIASIFKWSKFGPAIKTVGYTAPGESDDWMYGVHHIISMSPEVGPESGGFWPHASLIQGIDHRNFERTLQVVGKTGLEATASWSYVPLVQGALPESAQGAFQQYGGAPAKSLSVSLQNTGMVASAGEAVAVAIAGATKPARDSAGAAAAAVSLVSLPGDNKSSTAPSQLVSDGKVVVFQLAPLPRRSKVDVRLFVARDLEESEPQGLRICLQEMPTAGVALPSAAAAVAACQCLRPALGGAASAAQGPAGLYFVSGATQDADDRSLCAAAGSFSPGSPPTASTAIGPPVGQTGVILPPTSPSPSPGPVQAAVASSQLSSANEISTTPQGPLSTVALVATGLACAAAVAGLCMATVLRARRSGATKSTESRTVRPVVPVGEAQDDAELGGLVSGRPSIRPGGNDGPFA